MSPQSRVSETQASKAMASALRLDTTMMQKCLEKKAQVNSPSEQRSLPLESLWFVPIPKVFRNCSLTIGFDYQGGFLFGYDIGVISGALIMCVRSISVRSRCIESDIAILLFAGPTSTTDSEEKGLGDCPRTTLPSSRPYSPSAHSSVPSPRVSTLTLSAERRA